MTDRVIMARRGKLEVVRYTNAARWCVEHVGKRPPEHVLVDRIKFYLDGWQTRLPVAEAAMVAAWSGCGLTDAAQEPRADKFRVYFFRHCSNAAKAGARP